jgi:hypothetical protein
MANAAMFEGLIVDDLGRPVDVAFVGANACYVVDDDGFRRHIDAAKVDGQVLAFMKEQMDTHREIAVPGILEMMGQDDLFTKAAVESSIDKMEEAVGNPLPNEAKSLLGMLGFQIVVDFHGDVVEIKMPEQGIDEGDL